LNTLFTLLPNAIAHCLRIRSIRIYVLARVRHSKRMVKRCVQRFILPSLHAAPFCALHPLKEIIAVLYPSGSNSGGIITHRDDDAPSRDKASSAQSYPL
jgi:hypothetical protein